MSFLTKVEEVNPKEIKFGDPNFTQGKDYWFYRVPIQYKDGPLYVRLYDLYSYGIVEFDTGYTVSLRLDTQQNERGIKNICLACASYMAKNDKQLGKDVSGFNLMDPNNKFVPIYQKDKDSPKYLNLKLKKRGKRISVDFIDAYTRKRVDAKEYIDQRFQLEQAIVKIDSIYVSDKACKIMAYLIMASVRKEQDEDEFFDIDTIFG